jgi:cytosine/adenosine deaminase-related metal-dependent hydrolase
LSDALLVGPDAEGRTVAITGGRVVPEVGPDARRLEATGATITPGQVNAHTHLYSGLAPLGMPDPQPPPQNFVQILERVWWRLDRALDADSLHASARFYVAQALLSGTTCLIDHHESPGFIEGSLDVLADAYGDLGMRGLLAYGATERNRGPEEASAGLAECARFVRDGGTDTVVGAVALHASFTVSDETIRSAGALCDDLDTVLHVHVAEDGADVVDARERGYAGPLERLEQLGALPSGSILAHGIHLDSDQVRRAAEQGCWWVQNPRSNEGNRVGYASALDATDRVALGTDGWAADMEIEAEALQRLGEAAGADASRRQRRLAAGQALAAELFGVSADVLAPGALGDLVIRDDVGVRHVVVGGQIVVKDRALASGELETISAEAERQAAGLWRRMAAL